MYATNAASPTPKTLNIVFLDEPFRKTKTRASPDSGVTRQANKKTAIAKICLPCRKKYKNSRMAKSCKAYTSPIRLWYHRLGIMPASVATIKAFLLEKPSCRQINTVRPTAKAAAMAEIKPDGQIVVARFTGTIR